MGFIFCGLILLVAIFVGSIFTIMSKLMPSSPYGNMPVAVGGFISVFYILIDVLYFFFPFYLYRFSSRLKKGLTYQDTFHVTSALSSLKSFFKLWGIVTIIVISLYLLIIVVAIIGGVGASMMHR